MGGACVAAAAIRATECCSRVADPRAAEMFGALVLGIAFSSIALLARRPLVSRVAGEVALLAAVLVTVEVAVTATRPANGRTYARHHAAVRLGLPFDLRSISEVVESLRAQGVEALPGIERGWARQERVRRHLAAGFYPLSHASNSTIVECNESGDFLVYRTDEFGFNNPHGLVASAHIAVAVVGESFALGSLCSTGSVRPWTSFAGCIHGRPTFPWPAQGLSLSSARFARYVEPLQPPVVLWIVDAGFAVEEKEERDNVNLTRYLNPSFSQGLAERQNETDAVVRRLAHPIRAQDDRLAQQEVQRPWVERFSNLYALSYVRQSLNPMTNWRSPVPPPDLMLFKQCLQLAQQAAAAWGGKLLVVNLPSYAEVTGQEPEALSHRTVVEIVADIRASPDRRGGIVPVTRRSGGSLCTANGIPSKRRRARVAGASDPRGTRSDPRTAPRRRPLVSIAQALHVSGSHHTDSGRLPPGVR